MRGLKLLRSHSMMSILCHTGGQLDLLLLLVVFSICDFSLVIGLTFQNSPKISLAPKIAYLALYMLSCYVSQQK